MAEPTTGNKQEILEYIRELGRAGNITGLLSTRRGHFSHLLGRGSGQDAEAIRAANEELAKLGDFDVNLAESLTESDIVSRIDLYNQGQKEKKETTTEADIAAEKRRKLIETQTTKIKDFTKEKKGEIDKRIGEFTGQAKTYREQLAERLAGFNKQILEKGRPERYEELNRLGLFTSPSEMLRAELEAEKDLSLKREETLMGFDTDAFNQEQALRDSATNVAIGGIDAEAKTFLGGEEAALDTYLGGRATALESVINTRRTGLERSFQLQDQAAGQAAREILERRARKAGITNALIQGGAGILSAGMGNWGPMFSAIGKGASGWFNKGNTEQSYTPSYDFRNAGSTLGPLRFGSRRSFKSDFINELSNR